MFGWNACYLSLSLSLSLNLSPHTTTCRRCSHHYTNIAWAIIYMKPPLTLVQSLIAANPGKIVVLSDVVMVMCVFHPSPPLGYILYMYLIHTTFRLHRHLINTHYYRHLINTHTIDAVTTKNPYGMLPLRTAIRSKASTEVIDALIRAAPEVVTQFGVSGKTCLHLACLYSMDFDLFHELLTLWPDATKWKDRDGWCVLILAVPFDTKI